MSQLKHLNEYKAVREKWVHEDNVISHRINWLIFSQAMLLATFGWAIFNPIDKTQKLVILLPIFGMIFTAVIGVSVISAIVAQHKLHDYVKSKNWPEPYGVDTYSATNWPGRIASISLPMFMFIIWLVVGVA